MSDITKYDPSSVPGLYKLLSYRRPHNSAGEKQYIIDIINPLKPEIIINHNEEIMAFFVYVGTSNIMFTSHVDTVHMQSPLINQQVFLEEGFYCKKDGQPLGADDAAGNWLMLHMINANVPGVYAFFRGEERGGIGSSFCAQHRKNLFKGIDVAIAFDRRGTESIITHQGAGRGCSDEFGNSLSKVINLGHKTDQTGIYTDTAEFFHIVPNCTNISVGYYDEHSKKERLNKNYIEKLRDQLIIADWSKLDLTPPVPDTTPNIFFNTTYSKQKIFDDAISDPYPVSSSSMELSPLHIADFLFDHAECLPKDLRTKTYKLAQTIYKRFE